MTVYIPDIHQDIEFVNRILYNHSSADKYIFLGDYWDTFDQNLDIVDFSHKLLTIWEKLGDKAVWLIGNHDIAYCYACTTAIQKDGTKIVKKYNPYECSGYTRNKAQKVAKIMPMEFWNSLKLADYDSDNNILASHAGFSPNQIPYTYQDGKMWGAFVSVANQELNQIKHIDARGHWIVAIPESRGGNNKYGGPLWKDWSEFTDSIPDLIQIVGHTTRWNDVRINGNNYCIDAMQTAYAVFDGDIHIRYAHKYD